MGLPISQHAIERFKLRVADLPDEEVLASVGAALASCQPPSWGVWHLTVTQPYYFTMIIDNGLIVTIVRKSYRRHKKRQLLH